MDRIEQLKHNMQALPAMCYSRNHMDDSLIIIKSGESGFYETNDKAQIAGLTTDEMADRWNESMNVTRAQREAMTFGSIFGWDKTGADPATYADRFPIAKEA